MQYIISIVPYVVSTNFYCLNVTNCSNAIQIYYKEHFFTECWIHVRYKVQEQIYTATRTEK